MYKCKTCKNIKEQHEFYKNNRTASGYNSECKVCCKERVKTNYIIRSTKKKEKKEEEKRQQRQELLKEMKEKKKAKEEKNQKKGNKIKKEELIVTNKEVVNDCQIFYINDEHIVYYFKAYPSFMLFESIETQGKTDKMTKLKLKSFIHTYIKNLEN